jgi:hypothetical protein
VIQIHRIDGQNNVNNQFVNGARVTAEWLNSMQEEICTVIENSGITLLNSSTDTRGQLYSALSTMFEPTAYSSTMTDSEFVTSASSSQRKGIYILDAGGSERNFNPTGTFATGFNAVLINIGDENIIFDSTVSAEVIIPGSSGSFYYTGSVWVRMI